MLNRILPVLFLFPVFAQAESIVCQIEQPCIWASQNPPELSFCPKKLEGDEKTLTLTLEDTAGHLVRTETLVVSELSSETLNAATTDGKFQLETHWNGGGRLGGLTIRPENVGFFVFCETLQR